MKFKEYISEGKMKKVFLGGTCNESTWREELIPLLKINYFDPVIKSVDWNEEAYQRELKEREISDFLLYVITPKMTGVYSIAECIDDSNKKPDKTIFCYLNNDGDKEFDKSQRKSLDAVGKMVTKNGGHFMGNLKDVAKFLNEEINNY